MKDQCCSVFCEDSYNCLTEHTVKMFILHSFVILHFALLLIQQQYISIIVFGIKKQH